MTNETVDTAENASVESTEESQDANFEAQASKMGWKPQEKFKGDPARWVDAKTYVERGEEVLPIVKAQLRKTETELAEVRKAAQEWQEFNRKATEREVSEWRAKFEQAVQDKAAAISKGDGEAAVEAEARQEELKANRPEQPKKDTPQVNPLFAAWKAQNDWFDVDEEKTDIATGIGLRLAKKGVQGEEFFKALDAEMERRTQTPPRAGPQRGGRTSGDAKVAKTYENLKPEFKSACDRMVGTLKIKKEDYVAGCDAEAFRS